ncbi:MAG TPA: sulfur carrier protein ThiS [Bacteroidales bacterium]|nr:sulfur carrier protein ThiS [Bacteroidales bacterium]
MEISVNGKVQQIPGDEILLLELITKNGVKQPDMVSVQLNGSFIRKEDFRSTVVKDKNEVDFLYFMGGGKYLFF